jgi:hypothetical protein
MMKEEKEYQTRYHPDHPKEEQPEEVDIRQMNMFVHSSVQFLHDNLWKQELTSEDLNNDKRRLQERFGAS